MIKMTGYLIAAAIILIYLFGYPWLEGLYLSWKIRRAEGEMPSISDVQDGE